MAVQELWKTAVQSQQYVLKGVSLAAAATTSAELKQFIAQELAKRRTAGWHHEKQLFQGPVADPSKFKKYQQSRPLHFEKDAFTPDREEEIAVGQVLIKRLEHLMNTQEYSFEELQHETAILFAQLELAAAGQTKKGSRQNLKGRMVVIKYLATKALSYGKEQENKPPANLTMVGDIDSILTENTNIMTATRSSNLPQPPMLQ